MSGPVPSRLVFLSDLAGVAQGDKVRFLGCVERYDTTTATLVLTHHYPHDSSNQIVAFVNVEHLLESIKSSDMKKGAWINVIGYKTPPTPTKSEDAQIATQIYRPVYLQGIMLWSAGAVKLDTYERALVSRLQTEK